MDEYFSEKSANEARKLCGFGDPVDALKSFYEAQRSRVRICVEGYDTSLPAIDIAKALTKNFSPCGEIYNLVIHRDPVTNVVVDRCAYFELSGEGAAEKALALNGTDVGGWNVAVKVLPHQDSEFTTHQLAAMTDAHFRKSRDGISVTGYDPSLPANDVKSALSKHFASCGEITDVFVLNRRAFIYFFRGDTRKAVELSGSKMGGWELVAKALPRPKRNLSPGPPGLPFGYTVPADSVETAHRKFMAEKMMAE